MSDAFKTPNFKKDSVRVLCEKIWLSGKYEFKKLHNRVGDLEKDGDKVKIDVAGIRGELKIIIYMGAAALGLLGTLLVVIIDNT